MRDGKISTEEYQKLKDMDIREIDPASAADIRDQLYRHGLPPVRSGGVPGKIMRRPPCGTIQLRPASRAA